MNRSKQQIDYKTTDANSLNSSIGSENTSILQKLVQLVCCFTKAKPIFLAIFLLSSLFLSAQVSNKADSLGLLLVTANEPEERLSILLELANYYYRIDEAKSQEFANEIIEHGKDLEQEELVTEAYLINARLAWQNSKYSEALGFAHHAQEIALMNSLENQYADALVVTSNIYTEVGDYSRNSELLFAALNIYEKIDNKPAIAYAYSSIAGSFYNQKNWEKALFYSKKSLEISRSINNQKGIARSLNNLGSIYGDMGDIAKQAFYLKGSVEIFEALDYKLESAINYMNLGELYSEMNKYDTSNYYYQKSLNISTDKNNEQLVSKVNLLMAYNLVEEMKYEEALGHILTSLEISEEKRLLNLSHDAYEILHRIYFDMGNLPLAYNYSLKLSESKDSLSSKSSIDNLLYYDSKYQFEKALLEAKNEQKLKNLRFNIVLGSIIALVLMVTILIIYFLRMRIRNNLVRQKQLELDIELKNRELTSYTVSQLKANDILKEVEESILKLDLTKIDNANKQKITRISNKLKLTSKSKLWEDFEFRFKQVHSGFYENLLKQYPKLTPNELRLCSLLKLNMSNKEISELTGRNTASLEVARTRLRKKLGLTDRKINLVIFLSQF